MKVAVIHGPNLNLLGSREVGVYGARSLSELDQLLGQVGQEAGIEVVSFQSNHEGEIVDFIQASQFDGLVINPGAFTHYSIAIRDALAAIEKPKVEVHLSNINQREDFRKESVITPVVNGQISGLGFDSYLLGLLAVKNLLL